jgi:2-amino-4-hydroxy-6-hydroxymethyldihydropteridine diphosphokinase
MENKNRVLISVKVFSHRGTSQLREALKNIQRNIFIESVSSVYQVDRAAESWAGLRDIQKEERLEGLVLVVMGSTAQSAEETLRKLENIEMEMQREVLRRTISLNLLVFNTELINLPGLTVPHPEMHLRPEDVVPAVEVWPEYKHPVLKKSLQELSNEFKHTKWGEFYTQGAPLLDKQ